MRSITRVVPRGTVKRTWKKLSKSGEAVIKTSLDDAAMCEALSSNTSRAALELTCPSLPGSCSRRSRASTVATCKLFSKSSSTSERVDYF